MRKPVTPKPPALRFWAKVQEAEAHECWTWIGAKVRNGYGHFYVRPGLFISAHRFAYQELIGEIPDGLQLDHLCLNPPCVNPWHLDPVTSQVNTRRAADLIRICPHGHEYTPENTRMHKGGRECRTCNRIRQRDDYVPTPKVPAALRRYPLPDGSFVKPPPGHNDRQLEGLIAS